MKSLRTAVRRLLFFSVSLAVAVVDRLEDALRFVLHRPRPGSCIVLCYHSIAADQQASFHQQVRLLKRCCLPLPADFRGRLQPGRRHVVLTFDDGFVSVRRNALPVLESEGVPCTLFIPAGRLGKKPDWIEESDHPDREERVMTEDDLRELAHAGIRIGSHSMTHADLTRLAPALAFGELRDSKAELERITGSEVALFAFPHGFYHAALLAAAREAGYQRVFTLDPQTAFWSPDEFVTGRIEVGPRLALCEFRLMVLGAYRWLSGYYRLKRMLGLRTPAG